MDFTAKRSGYYRVFVDSIQVSQHTSEREAQQKCTEVITFENTVYYDHDYEVEVTINTQDEIMKTIAGTLTHPDSTPASITGQFNDESDVTASTTRTSNAVTITDVDSFAEVSITVTGDGGYRLNGAAATTAPGIGSLDDTIQLEHTASGTPSGQANTTLILDGTVSDTFTSTTVAATGTFIGDPVFVDPVAGTITNGTYNHVARDNTGTDGYNSYSTISAALSSLSGSNNSVYIRDGTYTGFVELDGGTVPNGTASEWNAITSYPGEWAVIDGNGATTALGRDAPGRSDGLDLSYWRFERLEITGGNRNGMHLNKGPFIVRYCKIHDNLGASDGDNPGGIIGYVWQNSLVEYNWFYNNGGFSANNQCHISLFSDYIWSPRDIDNINNALHSNEWRYNYFDTAYVGIKHKGPQFLCDESGTDFTYQDYGDKIHHNFFINHDDGVGGQNSAAILAGQDFCQIYQNIVVGSPIHTEEKGTNFEQLYHTCVYNNTVLDGFIRDPVGAGFSYNPYHPYTHVISNIIDGFGSDGDVQEISIGLNAASGGQFIGDDLVIETNLIHDPLDSQHISLSYGNNSGDPNGEFSVSAYDSAYSATNYTNSNSGLFLGASGVNQYRTDGTFILSGGITTTNGGYNTAHPYLSGVSFPAFVGATKPSDDDWVAGLINDVQSVSWLTAQAEDTTPTWVES